MDQLPHHIGDAEFYKAAEVPNGKGEMPLKSGPLRWWSVNVQYRVSNSIEHIYQLSSITS